MPRRNSLGFLITALGLAAASATGARTSARSGDEEKALRLLVKAFDRISPKNVLAIMRMSLDSPGDRQTVQVHIAKDGRQRVEVFEPLSRKGLIILELGERREIYNPDKGTLSIGRSMMADLFHPADRLRLVRRNYTLRMTDSVSMADRNVVRIDATSRYPELGGARIFIDPESYFVMRVDGVSPSGAVTKRFETTTVSYPATLPPGLFDLAGVNATIVQNYDPKPVSNTAEAARNAGFKPLSPHEYPFGFILRKTYVGTDPSFKTIGFDLSDGLASAKVFEFNLRQCSSEMRKSLRAEMQRRPQDFFSDGDVVVGIVSELGPKARKTILNAFRPKRHSAMNETENSFIDDAGDELSLGLGTNQSCRRVRTYRRMWLIRPQIG